VFQHKYEDFTLAQFLPASVSPAGIAQFLAIDPRHLPKANTLCPEAVGAALLDLSDLCDARNSLLQAPNIRFAQLPVNVEGMRDRIEWMIHCRTSSDDRAIKSRANDASDLILDQLGWLATDEGEHGQYRVSNGSRTIPCEPEEIARRLFEIAHAQPDLVRALLSGDLEAVPAMIERAKKDAKTQAILIQAAAAMYVVWALFELQREACLGWRLIYKPIDGMWELEPTKRYTIGQVFRPKLELYHLAEEMADHFRKCRDRGVDHITDKRVLNKIEARAKKHGYGRLNRENEAAIIASFGRPSIESVEAMISDAQALADPYFDSLQALMKLPEGNTRAGQGADMLSARISAVHRTAIVAARAYELSKLAGMAATADDLRAMLNTHIPRVLQASDNKVADAHKLRLRQLFHVYRIEFLRDAEHLPKNMKGNEAHGFQPPLELNFDQYRRGRGIFDQAWAALNSQPEDWRFMTPFGWQCDSKRVIKKRC
jgi:hypothetical protein